MLSLTALLSALMAASCGPEIIADPAAIVVVVGTVTDPAGLPVPGAAVRASGARDDRCAALTIRSSPDTTNSAGAYRHQLLTLGNGFQGCVRVVVTPPAGSQLVSDSVDRTGVEFRDRPPLDTVRIDVSLRTGAPNTRAYIKE